MVIPAFSIRTCRHAVLVGLVSMGFAALGSRPAFASEEILLDSAAISQLEQQASTAQLKEQCFLYTEVLHSLTEIAGKQLADGQDEQAAVTFHHIDTVVAKIQQALAKDAKRLKNAEMLMEHTTRRLSDMLHITNGDERAALQGTLQKVTAVHSQLLSQVFAK